MEAPLLARQHFSVKIIGGWMWCIIQQEGLCCFVGLHCVPPRNWKLAEIPKLVHDAIFLDFFVVRYIPAAVRLLP